MRIRELPIALAAASVENGDMKPRHILMAQIVAASLVVGFLLASVVADSIGKSDPIRVFEVGAFLSVTNLLGLWLGFGRTVTSTRFSACAGFVTLMWFVLVGVDHLWSFQTTAFAATNIMLVAVGAILVRRLRFQLSQLSDNTRADAGCASQFTLKHLFGLAALTAVCLGASRGLILSVCYDWTFIFLAYVFGPALVSHTALFAVLGEGNTGLRLAYFFAGVSAFAVPFLIDEPRGWMLSAIIAIAAGLTVAALATLRLAGYRLARHPRPCDAC
jgi:hypothetical protein